MLNKKKKNPAFRNLVALGLLAILFLSGCTGQSDTKTQTVPPTPTSAITNSDNTKEVYQAARDLLSRNYDIFYKIFVYNQLVVEVPENNNDGGTIYPVKDDRFNTYADLETYVKSTYIASFADSLLSNGLYINRDGKLYMDINKQTGGGYYIDWNNYTYEVSDVVENSATVTLKTTQTAPNGTDTAETTGVTLTGKLIKVNGTWLLEKIIE